MSDNRITTHWHSKFGAMRTVEENEKIAFVLNDVCRILGIDPEEAKRIVGSEMAQVNLDVSPKNVTHKYYDGDGNPL